MAERDHQKNTLLWAAELRRENNDHPIGCRLLDISAGGAKVQTDAPIPLGSNVELIVSRLAVAFPGKILWQRGMHTGIGFLENPHTVRERLAEAVCANWEPVA